MSSFFTGICMQASKTAAKRALRSVMQARGFRTDNKNPELRLVLLPCGKKWTCMKSLQMDFEDIEGFLADCAAHLGAPMLTASCFDSDFVLLTLYRDGQSDAACIGEPYDGEKPAPNPEFWQALVGDFTTFSELLSRDFVFAEETLVPLGEMMGFDGEALLPDEALPENALVLGFSRGKVKEKPLLSSGPTRLAYQNAQEPKPYNLHQNSIVVMNNYGGPSRGIEILLELSFPENRKLEYEIFDTHIRTIAQQMERKPPTPVTLRQIEPKDGLDRWHAVVPDFEIPEGINLNYEYPPGMWKQKSDTEFKQSIVFNYQLRIPEYLEKLNMRFTPLEYPEGAYSWRLEDCRITPQAMEVFYQEGPEAFMEILRKNRRMKDGK